MIGVRKALVRHAISFFETELLGCYRWGTGTIILPPEANTERDEEKPLRERVFGKNREIVEITFGPWSLTLKSPTEAPPVGVAILKRLDERHEGPIDQSTWKLMGEIVRSTESDNECKPKPSIEQRSDPVPGWGSGPGPA